MTMNFKRKRTVLLQNGDTVRNQVKHLLIILSILLLSSPQRVYKCWHLVNIGRLYAITRDWFDNLLWRIGNTESSTQSFCLQKVNMWLFKLSFSHYWLRKKMNKILHIILISLFSLTIISCAKKSSTSSSSTTDDTSTTTTTITSETTVAGVIYRSISVKKKNTNLNFDNAQFGNVKFQ